MKKITFASLAKGPVKADLIKDVSYALEVGDCPQRPIDRVQQDLVKKYWTEIHSSRMKQFMEKSLKEMQGPLTMESMEHALNARSADSGLSELMKQSVWICMDDKGSMSHHARWLEFRSKIVGLRSSAGTRHLIHSQIPPRHVILIDNGAELLGKRWRRLIAYHDHEEYIELWDMVYKDFDNGENKETGE